LLALLAPLRGGAFGASLYSRRERGRGEGHATDPKARHSIHEVLAAAAQGGGGAGREARGPASAVGVVGWVELGRGVWRFGWGEAAGVPDRARGGDGASDGARDGGGAGVLRDQRGSAADAGAHHWRAAQAGAAAAVMGGPDVLGSPLWQTVP